jgi:hypothetical protein
METSDSNESPFNVSAKEFFVKWKDCAKSINNLLVSFYVKPFNETNIKISKTSPRKTTFTNIVIDGVIKDEGVKISLVDKVAEKLGLEIYKEFYYTDAVFYRKCDKIKFSNPNAINLHTIRIAFEHEFDDVSKNLIDEISHLININCKLRVLVSYASAPYHKNSIDTYDGLKEGFNDCHKMISECPDSPNFSKDDSFLFILGYIKENNLEWQGFIYKREDGKPHEWKEIMENHIQ